jgi:hypothetical protein
MTIAKAKCGRGNFGPARKHEEASSFSYRCRPACDRAPQQKESHIAMQFSVVVEIEGASPETFKIGFKFSDEEGSGMEFYCNHELPKDVSERLGALSVDFVNNIGDVVLRRLH